MAEGNKATRTEGKSLLAKPVLVHDEHGLKLVSGDMELRGDFTSMIPRLASSRRSRELLVKAARVRGFEGSLYAVDMTAGLGEDSLLLAAAGFTVTLFERDETIVVLLEDAIERAAHDPKLASTIARMQLVHGDAIEGIRNLERKPDVVYLDPMFPSKRKDALTKKKLQIVQMLERPCEDEGALVEAALSVQPKKVVIKRPAKGPYLAGIKPSYSLQGKVVRFDCLVP